MGPSKDAFAVCGAIFFAVLGAMLMAKGEATVQNLAANALLAGALSQWLAQVKGLERLSGIVAYVGMLLVLIAMAVFFIR